MTSFYNENELNKIGFKSIGSNVLLSKKASIYGAKNISIKDNTRIDDFCILSGNINIGSNVHIAAGVFLFGGKGGIVLEDFVGISSRTVVYAESDDYLGEGLTNPTIPDKYRKISGGMVVFRKHSLIGTGCTVLPNVIIGEGTSVGSMSLINKSLDAWGVYIGIPCKRIKNRKKDLLELEKLMLDEKI